MSLSLCCLYYDPIMCSCEQSLFCSPVLSTHHNGIIIAVFMHAVPGLPLPCCNMPRGRTSTTRGAAVSQPSQRRAAIRKRAAETAPPMPAPPVRRRRRVSSAAGGHDESVIPDGGPPTVSTSTAEMVAIVTREVLKQLRDDRTAVPVAGPAAPVDVPAAPVDVPAAPIAVPDLMMPPVVGNPTLRTRWTILGGTCFSSACMQSRSGGAQSCSSYCLPQPIPSHSALSGRLLLGVPARGQMCLQTCRFKRVCAKCQAPYPSTSCPKHSTPHTSKP